MPERTTRKRKTRADNNEDRKETYSRKLRRHLTRAEEKSKLVDKDNNNLTCLTGHSSNIDVMVTSKDSDICRKVTEGSIFALKPREHEPQIHGFTPLAYRSQNLVHFLQQYSRGQKATVTLKKSLSSTVVNRISDLQLCRKASPFERRVTAMEWHPTNPNILAVGSKGGDIILWDTINVNNDKLIQGMGPGGSINAMKFWPLDLNMILSAAVDGTVRLNDLDGRNSKILADTMNAHQYWYCSVDISEKRKLIVAGDNVGNTQLLSFEGQKVFNCRLHKQKVTHAEFSPREEWLLCTSSTDQTVQFWDVRMMKDKKSSLQVLKHDKGINSAYFSETDGCRLLTTDQKNEVRVYKAPEWNLERTIQHPHRFFQHITPIKATWHPLLDLAVIGRYPDPTFPGYHEGELRSIDIIDVETGELVTSLSDPSAPGLVCLNKFNRRGDVLASGMGVNILLWTRKEEVLERQTALMSAMKSYLDNSSHSNPTNSRRQPRQSKTIESKLKNSTEKLETKSDKEKLKVKMKNSKK